MSAVAVITLGCADQKPAPTALEFSTPLFITVGRNPYNFGTNLRGEQEVFSPANPGDPTPADSHATGQANFRVSDDGSRVRFILLAEHIDNIIMAHVHCGLSGANGPIRIWLYPVVGPSGAPAPAGAGPFSGRLAEGTFDPTGIICPASAVGTDMPVLDAMRLGLAYVNVHTNDGIAPTNTGPGDFPGGEIRGQLANVVSH